MDVCGWATATEPEEMGHDGTGAPDGSLSEPCEEPSEDVAPGASRSFAELSGCEATVSHPTTNSGKTSTFRSGAVFAQTWFMCLDGCYYVLSFRGPARTRELDFSTNGPISMPSCRGSNSQRPMLHVAGYHWHPGATRLCSQRKLRIYIMIYNRTLLERICLANGLKGTSSDL